MFRKLSFLIFLGVFCLCLSPVMAAAATIFSDLQPDNTYRASGVLGVYGDFGVPHGPITPASQFTAAASGQVEQIDVAVGSQPGYSSTQFVVSIFDSVGNTIPATAKALYTSAAFTTSQVYGQPVNGVLSKIDVTGLYLTQGNTYFMVVNVVDPLNPNVTTNDGVWYTNSLGTNGYVLLSYTGGIDGSTWTQYSANTALGAFDIISSDDSTQVPEPSTMLLLGAGLAGVGFLRTKLI